METPATHQRRNGDVERATGFGRQPLRVLEQHLQRQAERGQDHLAAERFTVADLCVASVMGWVKPARALLEAYPATHAWLARCLDRPAQQAMRALARQQH